MSQGFMCDSKNVSGACACLECMHKCGSASESGVVSKYVMRVCELACVRVEMSLSGMCRVQA